MSRNDTKPATNGRGGPQSHGPITRDDVIIYNGEIASLRRFKDDVPEVRAGLECGVTFAGVLFIVGAYWLGRRKGRKRKTVLEIRRI